MFLLHDAFAYQLILLEYDTEMAAYSRPRNIDRIPRPFDSGINGFSGKSQIIMGLRQTPYRIVARYAFPEAAETAAAQVTPQQRIWQWFQLIR